MFIVCEARIIKDDIMEKEIFNELLNNLVENFNISKKSISLDKDIRTNLGLDSFDMAELSFIIKEKFGVEITQDNSSNIKTVGDIVSFIETNIKNIGRIERNKQNA